jgi:hypothetical protein
VEDPELPSAAQGIDKLEKTGNGEMLGLTDESDPVINVDSTDESEQRSNDTDDVESDVESISQNKTDIL